MAKPTLVLCHGSWHRPAHFAPLIAQLEKHGYTCVPVAMPSTLSADSTPPPPDADDKAVRSAVVRELDKGTADVFVVAHSFAGTIVNNCLEGLDASARKDAGEKTAVVGIALLCAFVLPVGMTMEKVLGYPYPPLHDKRGEYTHITTPPGHAHFFYNDLAPEEAKKWTDMCLQQAWAAYTREATYFAAKVIPTSYLFCALDQAIPTFVQRGVIEGINEQGGPPCRVEEVESSHSPFLSMPERTSDFIRRSVGEEVAM